MSPRTRVLQYCSENSALPVRGGVGPPSPTTLPRVCLAGATTRIYRLCMHHLHYCCPRAVYLLLPSGCLLSVLYLAGRFMRSELCPVTLSGRATHPPPSQTSGSVLENRPDSLTGSLVGWLPLNLLLLWERSCREPLVLTSGSIVRMVTFGQPLQGVHLIDKPCPRLWTTWSMYG